MTDIEVHIAAEDPRYPTLVMSGENFLRCYDIDADTGLLLPREER